MTKNQENKLTGLQRREVSQRLYPFHSDDNLECIIRKDISDVDLIESVVNMFETESKLIFPDKFIFCQIVYSYYLNKYFNLDFGECLNDRRINYDIIEQCGYDQRPYVYDEIIKRIDIENLDKYKSITKTRLYFKQEFLIYDEDGSSIDCTYNISKAH